MCKGPSAHSPLVYASKAGSSCFSLEKHFFNHHGRRTGAFSSVRQAEAFAPHIHETSDNQAPQASLPCGLARHRACRLASSPCQHAALQQSLGARLSGLRSKQGRLQARRRRRDHSEEGRQPLQAARSAASRLLRRRNPRRSRLPWERLRPDRAAQQSQRRQHPSPAVRPFHLSEGRPHAG
mgnify:CR=1 FL=1